MQKVVIDTNVFVSSLIQRNYPYLIVNDFLIGDKFSLCISEEVLKEYYAVLNRKKFARYPEFVLNAEKLLVSIEQKGKLYLPKKKLSIINDFDDNKFLELADVSKANFLITGNTNDFTIEKYKRTHIISPKEYWDNYRSDK